MVSYGAADGPLSILPPADYSTRTESNRAFEALAALQTMDLQIDIGRSSRGMLSDVGWIALGWLMLVTVIAYPVLQLIGLLACSIAIFFASSPPQPAAVSIRLEPQARRIPK
jgi:hypothetical protein